MDGYFMGMHRHLRKRKFLQATILSAKFISITTNTKFTKAVSYIHDNKSRDLFYVLLNMIFTCLRVLRLTDSNLVGNDKYYYYSRMTKQCTKKKYMILIIRNCSLIYRHQPVFIEQGIWQKWWRRVNIKICTLYSEDICFVMCCMWNERVEHINNDYSMIAWMFCVIILIREDVFKNAQNNHHIQVNTVIKNLFDGSTEN